jgi:alkanesulfonate monooxygenase SsuD/methylene tetrahydromethanopterin reductase-like flavin-dependent oxidoreductase (luciferase family)
MPKLGLLLSGGAAQDPVALADATLRLTHASRDAGFSALVVGQHFLAAPQVYFQPIPLLARLIPETADMRLVTGVVLLPLLHPVQLAEELATLDVLSVGRLTVGVGQGYREVELNAFGVERRERSARQLEALELLKEMWSGARIDHTGDYYSVRADGASVTPVQSPHPPVWYAASTEATCRRALREGYVPYIGPQVSRDGVAKLAAFAQSSPGSGVALRRDIIVTDVVDAQTARACVAAHEARYTSWGYGSGDRQKDDSRHWRKTYIIGSVDECQSMLADYALFGVTDVVLRVTWPGLSVEQSLSMLHALTDIDCGEL